LSTGKLAQPQYVGSQHHPKKPGISSVGCFVFKPTQTVSYWQKSSVQESLKYIQLHNL